MLPCLLLDFVDKITNTNEKRGCDKVLNNHYENGTTKIMDDWNRCPYIYDEIKLGYLVLSGELTFQNRTIMIKFRRLTPLSEPDY